jgi:2-C-methyl-D-erythritol 4-phosphate cytidylyltransferase
VRPSELHLRSIRVGLLVVGAGRGLRVGADLPKQYLPCAGRPLIVHTLETLAASVPFVAIVVVIRADDRALYDQAMAHLTAGAAAALGPPTIGGATRQQSVLAGLEALAVAEPDIVLIHDAVRPFPSTELVARAIDAAERHGAAAPGTVMSDTIKQVDAEGRILATPPRAALRAVQTPQAFRFPLIFAAHQRAAAAGVGDLTDDVAVAEWAGAPAYVFEGDPANVKVTTTSTRSPPATTCGSVVCASLIPLGSADTPTLTSRCMRLLTRSTAPWPRATSAPTSLLPTRNGRGRRQRSSSPTRSIASAPATAHSFIST